MGCGQSGVGDEYILGAAPHKVGDVSPVGGMKGNKKKHIVVVIDWLLLLLLLNTIFS